MKKETAARVKKISHLLKQAEHATALTGAGISTPSGIPDFRSADSGLWTRVNPFEVASLRAFRSHPERFFNWLRPLASQALNAQPNPAHLALSTLQEEGFLEEIITQNIDTLHQRAGSTRVIEVHGTLETMTCSECERQIEIDPETAQEFLEQADIPRCKHCSGVLKPDAVLFGEQLPRKAWKKARKASRSSDLMLVLGSSLTVMPVSDLPGEALQTGSKLIIINQEKTPFDRQAEVVIHGDLAAVLPKITEEVCDG